MTTETMMSVLSPSVRGMPRFSALAEAVLRQAADLATLVSSLGPGFSLASAEGTQLDQLAASLGLFRADTLDGAAASDETFRAYLRAKLALWRWDGTNETVPAMLAEAFPGGEVSITDNGDGTVTPLARRTCRWPRRRSCRSRRG